ncbi:MAG: uracil-DNA glycosylase [Erysipelotrichaceae bacterium]|jgi:uracil-DNA glycosylase|nr:uracil-DNA glycosylase [Erysipelotrichaceae bacterium]
MENIKNSWSSFFEEIKLKNYVKNLNEFLDNEYKNNICYPPRGSLLNAFVLTPLEDVKVVIIGQDPYHEEGQAMGLAFSVPDGFKIPPSLKNIYKEIALEYNAAVPINGDLTHLARQGVLLLNAYLSVRKGEPLSHKIKEYDYFLIDVLKELDKIDRPVTFLLWGGNARKLKKYIKNQRHLILEANHPSPLSANKGGWFGNNHFISTNEFLKKNNLKEIDWLNNRE